MQIKIGQPYSFNQMGPRDNQEDARYPDCDMPSQHHNTFLVCDGVGGQDKGEIASNSVAQAMGQFSEHIDQSCVFTPHQFGHVLEQAYIAIKKEMAQHGTSMATTMTYVRFHSEGVLCAHMGDSRIYHIRPDVGIMYRSDDHSLVNALVHSGNITPEEAINHPQSNIITRCIGYVAPGNDRPAATVFQIDDVETGDYFFLCSDGVCHCVDDNLLYTIISSESTDKDKIDTIAKACQKSDDNNTAYLIPIEYSSYHKGSYASCGGVAKGNTTHTLDKKMPETQDVRSQCPSALGRFFKFINRIFNITF